MSTRVAMAAMIAASILGCSTQPPPIVPVTGVVMLDGQPLPFAEVRFYPQAENLPADFVGVAITDENGRYTLNTNGQPGGCVCAHIVTVAEGPPPDRSRNKTANEAYKATLKNRPIPLDYGNLAQKLLTVTVTARQSEYPLDLKR
jgi:hypothetical protein